MPPRGREAARGPTATEALVDALRVRILEGDVAPGEPLREEELAHRYALSRHTVRAALAVLGSERLVEVVAYRGARVAALDDDALVALQQLRGALESEAVRILGTRHGESWPAAVLGPVAASINALADAEASGDWQRTTRAHAEVHRTLVAAAASPRITDAYVRLESEILLLLTHVRPDYPPGAIAAEHRAYLDAVRRGGGAAVRAHLAHSTDLIRAARRPRGGGDGGHVVHEPSAPTRRPSR